MNARSCARSLPAFAVLLFVILGCSSLRKATVGNSETANLASSTPEASRTSRPAVSKAAYVRDEASVLDPKAVSDIGEALSELESRAGIRFVVGTVNSTGEKKIDDFSADKLHDWDVSGEKGAILYLAAIKDRQWYIQVAPGSDIELTSDELKTIGGSVGPDFKAGRFSEGLKKCVRDMIAALAKDGGFEPVTLD